MFVALFIAGALDGATLCVGSSATGNGSGSDWNNLLGWSATPSRGDTWYLAGGSFSGKTFNTPVSGSTLITIKKATVADHGTSTGWNNTIASAETVFGSEIQFDSSYWVFDGQTGGGPGSWASGFGFQIACADDSLAIIRMGYNGPANNVTVRHVDLAGKGSASSQGGYYSNDGVALYGCSNITISYAWVHGAGRCPFFIDCANTIFEYFYVQSYYGTSSVHSEVASIYDFAGLVMGDTTFRNSLFTHIVSTGGLIFDNSSNPSSHLYVYGNVFYKPPGDSWDQANGLIGGWTGGNGEQMYNVWVYNNTFVNVDQLSLSNLPNTFGGCRAMNNLWYNCTAPDFSKFPTHDYNYFISSGATQGEASGVSVTGSDPFVNSAGLDFRLKANTPSGSNLGSPYNVDPIGALRSTWTRGAYEFGGSATTPTPTPTPTPIPSPAPPKNLRVVPGT